MYLKSLKPYNFRNLSNRALEFSPVLNLIRGKNGQGKTNLIEAIYLLCFTKGFRATSNSELIRWGEKEVSVFGELEREEGISLELGVAFRNGKKELYKDQQKLSSSAEYLGNLCCVCFTPDDLQILKGPPSNRRKFIDRHAFFLVPGYVEKLLEVQRALAHKGALLRSGVDDYKQYLPWNQIIISHGIQISQQRNNVVSSLREKSREFLSVLAPLESELNLRLSSQMLTHSSEDLLFKAEGDLHRELKSKSPSIGPQKDELEVTLAGKSVRDYASQGQTRSIVIALKLALIDLLEHNTHDAPLVVLDDVESELDTNRVSALFDLINVSKRQVFVTGTDCNWIVDRLGREANFGLKFEVESGSVKQVG